MDRAIYIIVVLAVIWMIDPLLQWRKLTGTTTLDDQTSAMIKFAEDNRFGSSPDYWLVKANAIGGPDRIALVFGLMDDSEMCDDLATMYMRKYPSATYVCYPAN